MATARKPGASRPKPKKAEKKPVRSAPARSASKPSPAAARAAARSKPVAGRQPLAPPAKKPVVGKPAVAARVIGKPAVAGKVIGKPAVAGRVIGKPAVAGKVIGKPAVAGKVIGRPAVPGKRVIGKPAVPGKGVPVPPVLAGGKPGGKLKVRVVTHSPKVEVRPIGTLPPEAVARAIKAHGPVVHRERPQTRPVRDIKIDQGAQGVTEKDYKEFEQRLITERQKIMKDMGYLESTVLKINQRDSAGDLSGNSFHMADVGTDAMEREKAFLFASAEGRLLIDINDALRKLYSGEYGTCEICEQPITRARLEAMPAARLCLACKEKQERENRGIS